MAHAPTDALARRHHAIRTDIAGRGLDALVVTALPNVTYLTNFTGSAAIVVLTDRLHFLTDSRYVTAVSGSQMTACACPGLELSLVEGAYDAALANAIASIPGARIGFEAAHLTV